MDTYLFRNPEEVSCLCSIQAHVVWVQFSFTIGLVIWFFKLNKLNNHNITFSFFKQAVNTNCKTIKHWKCKQRDFSLGEDGYRWKPYRMGCFPASSFHIPEQDEQHWGSTLPWVHSSTTIYRWHPASAVGTSPSSILSFLPETTRNGAIREQVTPFSEKGTEAMQKTTFRYTLKLQSLLNWCATHFKNCSYWGLGQPRTGPFLSSQSSPPEKVHQSAKDRISHCTCTPGLPLHTTYISGPSPGWS